MESKPLLGGGSPRGAASPGGGPPAAQNIPLKPISPMATAASSSSSSSTSSTTTSSSSSDTSTASASYSSSYSTESRRKKRSKTQQNRKKKGKKNGKKKKGNRIPMGPSLPPGSPVFGDPGADEAPLGKRRRDPSSVLIALAFAGAAALFGTRSMFFPKLWEHDDEREPNDPGTRATLNGALQAFLQVAGFLYVLVFASVLTRALDRREAVRVSLSAESRALVSIGIEARRLKPSVERSMALALLRRYTETFRADICSAVGFPSKKSGPGGGGNSFLAEIASLHAVVEAFETCLAAAWRTAHRDAMAAVLRDVRRSVAEVHAARSRRYSELLQPVSPVFWVYLASLAVVHFFAVLLLESGSSMVNVTLCALTVASFVISLAMLSAIDTPLRGAIRISLGSVRAEIAALERIIDPSTHGID